MIFSIGTSNRSLDEFLRELVQRSITQIVDVRSSPYSRLAWFNGSQIERWSEFSGMLYRNDGRVLGGRSTCQVGDPTYREAISRLAEAGRRENVAVFCAEGRPEECHRCFEVGIALLAFEGLQLTNILRDGSNEQLSETLKRVRDEQFPISLRTFVQAFKREDAKRLSS